MIRPLTQESPGHIANPRIYLLKQSPPKSTGFRVCGSYTYILTFGVEIPHASARIRLPQQAPPAPGETISVPHTDTAWPTIKHRGHDTRVYWPKRESTHLLVKTTLQSLLASGYVNSHTRLKLEKEPPESPRIRLPQQAPPELTGNRECESTPTLTTNARRKTINTDVTGHAPHATTPPGLMYVRNVTAETHINTVKGPRLNTTTPSDYVATRSQT